MRPDHGTPAPGGRQGSPVRAAGIILYRRAAGGAIEFLLLETRKGGHHSPAKGHLDPGETEEEAARREALEESGLRPLALDPGFRVAIEYEVLKKGEIRRKTVVYYLGEAAPGPVVLSDEHTAARWAPLDEVLRLVPFQNLARVFRAAAEHLARASGPATG